MIEPPETAHHAERHKSHIPWFDICMAVAVLVVSLGSLYVALHTGHTMEALVQQNQRLVRAQSTPILQYSHGNNIDGERALYFQIKNVGTGPGRIAWARITHAGKTYDTWRDFAFASVEGLTFLPFDTAPIAPTVLSAGEERMFMRWAKDDNALSSRAWDRVERSRFEAQAEACYCSVFDECWISNMNADVPRPVESCENPRPVEGVNEH